MYKAYRLVVHFIYAFICNSFYLGLTIFAFFVKLLLPKRAINAWRNWILNRAIHTHKDGSTSIKGSFESNPLLKYPRNFRCYCGSAKKAKVCCLPTTPEVCSPKEAMANKFAVKWAENLMKAGETIERTEASST